MSNDTEEQSDRSTPSPPRALAVVLVAIALLIALLVGLGTTLVMRDRDATMERAELAVVSAARTTAEHSRWIFHASLLVLDRFDQLLGDTPSVFARADIGELDQSLAALPGDPTVWVSNRFGVTVMSTNLDHTPQNISGRDYFLTLQDGTTWMNSKLLNEGDDEMVFAIARRIERDGEFMGVVGLVMPALQLSEFWSSLALRSDSTVALIRSDGWLVAGYPVPGEAVNVAEDELFRTRLPLESTGSYRSTAPWLDGRDRMIGYAKVPDLPLVATASVSIDSILAPFWQRFWLVLGIGVPVGIGLAGLAVWVVRLLRRDARQREQLRAALAHNRTLLADTHHRVRNNLQLISSMVRLHPAPEHTKQELARRVEAVAAFHRQLYLTDEFGSVDFASYLVQTIESLNESYGSRASIDYQIDQIRVDVRLALPLALIASEVAANALKHAFSPDAPGRLTVVCRSADRKITLIISDNGKGFVESDEEGGFGTALIRSLAGQVGAEFRYRQDGGTVFELQVSADTATDSDR